MNSHYCGNHSLVEMQADQKFKVLRLSQSSLGLTSMIVHLSLYVCFNCRRWKGIRCLPHFLGGECRSPLITTVETAPPNPDRVACLVVLSALWWQGPCLVTCKGLPDLGV